MRARNIKPGYFLNEDLADIEGPWGRLTFSGLWCLADKEGRLEDRPRRIKAALFPYDEKMPGIEKIISQLANKNFITRYQVNGQKYIQINKFKEHQSPHHTERASTLPSPDQGSDVTVSSPLMNGENPPDSLIPDSLIPDSNTLVHRRMDGDNGFDSFWSAYPKKIGRKAALNAWKKATGKPKTEQIVAAIEKQKHSVNWVKDGGQYIPNPTTWLNQGRWDDEPEVQSFGTGPPERRPCPCGSGMYEDCCTVCKGGKDETARV